MILIIGATSFIGKEVVKKLLDKNYNLKCLVRIGSNSEELEKIAAEKNKKIEFSSGNLNSSDSIHFSLKNAECVVYLVDLAKTDFVKNFLTAISRSNIKRVVFLGSTTVLTPFPSPLKEAKITSENLIKDSGLDYTILRCTMIYGSPEDKNFSKMIKFIKKRGFFVIFGSGNNLIQPIYIEDVAETVASVINNPKTYKKIYEISGREPLRYIDMLQKVRDIMIKTGYVKKPFKIIRLPLKLSKVAAHIYSRLFKNSELKPDMIERMEIDKAYSYNEAAKDFGFLPVNFELGIEKLLNKLKL